MNKIIKLLLLCTISLKWITICNAQSSYIYIELIKTIPCKIYQNNQEVIPLNKNYIILNVADQKEQSIDIEFGGDLYPKHNFIFLTESNASYGYKLAKSGEQSFYLLDLINNGKIVEPNSAVNIGISTEFNKINFGNSNSLITQIKKEKKNKHSEKFKEIDSLIVSTNSKEIKKYGVVEIINPRLFDENEKKLNETKKEKIIADNKPKAIKPTPIKIVKRKCNIEASNNEVERFIEKINERNIDDDKLLVARKKLFTGCLNVDQIMKIAENFETQNARYHFIRISMSNISNMNELPLCKSLFKTNSYQQKFLKLIDIQ